MTRTHITAAALTFALTCAVPTGALAATHRHDRHCGHHHCHTKARRHSTAHGTPTTPGQINPSVSIASVLATACPNAQLIPNPENLQAIRVSTLCLINQERARDNELPLQGNEQLEATAQSHSELMVSEDYFAHVTPAGETPTQRFEAAGYIPNQQAGYTVGENIAWGTLGLATPEAIVAAWIASPEHLANILEGSYTETGLGVVPAVPASDSAGQPGAIYTEDFGVIYGTV
jgi:uncharacterized protein YkwD